MAELKQITGINYDDLTIDDGLVVALPVKNALLTKSDTGHKHVLEDITDYVADTSGTEALAAITAHVADIENPHEVTAAQVGSYTKAEVDALFSGDASGILKPSDVVDNLTSTAVDKPLSANMGRLLNEVASGKTQTFVFATEAEFDTAALNWADPTDNPKYNTYTLKTGDVAYIKDVDVVDKWYDGDADSWEPLESRKMDLTDYLTKAVADTLYATIETAATKLEVSDLVAGDNVTLTPGEGNKVTIGVNIPEIDITTKADLDLSNVVTTDELLPHGLFGTVTTEGNITYVEYFADAAKATKKSQQVTIATMECEANSVITITLIKPFADTNYVVAYTADNGVDAVAGMGFVGVGNKKLDSFDVKTSGGKFSFTVTGK